MSIVTMATESYINWLYHLLSSLELTIPTENIIVFLINVEKKTQKKLSGRFKSVKFINEKKELIPVDPNAKGSFKVTYLKGEFMRKAYVRTGESLLWIDCTALIRESPEDLLNELDKKKVLLMRRNFNADFGKAVYACEIFGMNDWDTIKQYEKNCNKRKDEWFADQLALCEIETKDRSYITFGEWSNFNYNPNAKSWSDRGKTGSGITNQEDYNFTEMKFISDLENRSPGYEENYLKFYEKEKGKPKILVHIDDFQWCYLTTVKEVTERLKDKYDFLIIQDAKKDFEKYKNWKGDMVWARCSSRRHQKLLALRPDLKSISFSSVTTGGELAEDRITAHLKINKGEAGIICQNEDVKFRLEYKLKQLGRKQKVFQLFNGVDIKKFKPRNSGNKKPIVGFVGRTRMYQEDFIKGYSAILKPVCEELDLEILRATNEEDKVQTHENMNEFYKKIDILVLLGNCEGHSNTINEAMACGLPVIAYPVAWHIENAKNQGILFCHRSTIELKTILSDYKQHFKKYRELGQKNRKFVEKMLSWDNVAPYYDTKLQEMLKCAKLRPIQKKDNKIDLHTAGITEITYIAKDNGMDTQYGVFKSGKKVKVSAEAYNYFKSNFPNKFNFGDNE